MYQRFFYFFSNQFFTLNVKCLIVCCLLSLVSMGQTTFNSQNFGTSTTFPSGWSASNSWTCATSDPSTNYSGASGGAKALFSNSASVGLVGQLLYNSISTIGYNSVNIIWGARSASNFNQTVTFYWSTNGSTWNQVNFSNVSSDDNWHLVNGGTPIVLPAGAANVSNLQLKWLITVNNSGTYSIDDITINGAPIYTVTFNNNGGSGSMSDQSSSTASNLTSNTFTRTGYSFAGWNTAANGSGTAYANGASFPFTASTTLYAQWGGITGAATAAAFTTSQGTPSAAQSFSISGAYLTANLIATAPTGFEVSSNGTNYGSTATFTQTNGSASGTLYVRLAASATIGTYNNQNIVLSSTGATSVNISTTSSGNFVSPANDLCANPTPLVINANAVSGTTINSTLTVLTNDNKNPNSDVWYSFTPSVTSSITVTVNNSSFHDYDLFAYTSCPTSAASYVSGGSATGFTSTSETMTFTATAGTLYFIRVAVCNAFLGSTFTISASQPSSPSIFTSGSLAALSTTNGTASATTSFSVSGVYMSAGISINPPAGFEVSTSATFASNVGTNGNPIIVGAAGTIASTPIYVRLSATTAGGSYAGNISLSSSNATTVNVATASSVVTAVIIFDANGGTGSMANQSASTAAAINANTFTKTCSTFTGWNTAANGTGTSYANGATYAFSANTTLYAQWNTQNQWSGTTSNWNTASNWSCGTIPAATDNIIIGTGTPVLNTDFTVGASGSLTINGTGALTINPGQKLTLTGAADFGGRLVTVASNASGSGAIVLNGGALTGATNVGLQQWFSGQRAWRMLSNPFTTAITAAAIITNNGSLSVNQSGTGDMVVYTSANDTWAANTTIAANTCYGFFYKGLQSDFNGTPGLSNYSGAGPTATTFTVKGTLNTGLVSVTPNASATYTLVGNPYAAPVNSITLTGGIAAPYYYYQASSASTDIKVKSGAWIASASNSSNTTTIPMMGLIAYQAPNTNAFSITTAAINTTSSTVASLYKTTAANDQIVVELQKNNILFDRLIVREEATAGYNTVDANDLLKMENVVANIYALTAKKEHLAVHTEPSFTQAIPLGISAPIGAYQFKITGAMGASDWYLIDNYLHQQIVLNTQTTYSFDINNDAASAGESRFELAKKMWTTQVGNSALLSSLMLQSNLVQNEIRFVATPTFEKLHYKLLDTRGAILKEGIVNEANQTIAVDQLAAGMYILQVANANKQEVFKIVKQ